MHTFINLTVKGTIKKEFLQDIEEVFTNKDWSFLKNHKSLELIALANFLATSYANDVGFSEAADWGAGLSYKEKGLKNGVEDNVLIINSMFNDSENTSLYFLNLLSSILEDAEILHVDCEHWNNVTTFKLVKTTILPVSLLGKIETNHNRIDYISSYLNEAQSSSFIYN